MEVRIRQKTEARIQNSEDASQKRQKAEK